MDFLVNEDHGRRYERLERELQGLVGAHVAVVCTDLEGDIDCLWPEERHVISSAVPRRQREFAAGRSAAREAIRRLIGTEEPIPANFDRSPCWPAGIVGSIAHTSDACLAMVGNQNSCLSIGVDIESNTGIEESLWEIICNSEEMRFIRDQKPSEQPLFAKKLFVAKEAFYKWYFAQKRTVLDFHDVIVHWCDNTCEFKVSACGSVDVDCINQCNGQILTLEGYLIAYCATPIVHSYRLETANE